MVWVQLLWFVVTTVISIALAPKPRAPKAAAIEDFAFPTAEEGRPIPVVFGTVDISGPNCLWYGDLDTKKIKKRSGFSKQTVGYKYYIGFHLGLCHGEADAVSRIEWGEKEAWTGNITVNGSGTINAPDLFGGESREGGIAGDFDIMFGGDAQTANAYISGQLGGDTTAYRGIVSAIFKKIYIGTTPYVKPLKIRVKRIHKGWQGAEWYPEKAELPGGLMNPAHIMYQTLTDTEWGCGVPTSFLNDAVWRDAADTFYAENFGLALIWNQQSTIQQFLQVVVDHCAANLALRNDTGQYELMPIRGDYDPDDLITLDPSNVVELSDYQKQGWGKTVNEVTLVYTDPDTGKGTTVGAHDLGNEDAQAKNIPQTVELPGIRDHALANVVVMRELQSRCTPLGKGTLIANRDAWQLPYGDVFKLTWPERNLDEVVHRVLSINRGTLRDNQIVVEFVEDIYGLELGEYLTTNPVDPDPPAVPVPPDDPDPGIGVISTTENDPPVVAYPGDSYWIPLSPPATGDWAGHEGETADWDEDAGEWTFTPLPEGTLVYDSNTGTTYQVQGGDLVPFGGGGGAITIIDEDADPDEVIDPVETILIKGAKVDDLSTGGVRIEVSPLTTKGDLYARGSSGNLRRSIGTEGYYLRARAADATGMAWENPTPVGEGASGCRAYKNATQSIADATLVALTWQAEAFDTDAYHDNSSNTSRLTAVVAGKYVVGCSVEWDADTTGVRELYVCVNGSTATRIAGALNAASAGLVQSFAVALDLAANDYVEIYARQNSGGARNVGAASEQVSTAWITRVGVTTAPTMMRGATWVRAVGVIAVPVSPVYVRCPVKGTIVGVSIGTVGGPGACVIDITKDTHANFPPTSPADSIVAAAPPTISAASKYEDTTLTGWTTTINAGDWLGFHLSSSSSFTSIYVQLFIKETQ